VRGTTARAVAVSTPGFPKTGLPRPFASWEELPFPLLCAAVGLIWCVISFILYAPPLFIPIYPTARIRDVMLMSDHPLRRDLYEVILTYRVTLPLIAYVTHLRGYAVVTIQYVANVAFLSLTFAALCTRTSRRVAFLGVALVALSHAGQTGNTWIGYQDSIVHLCTTICLLTTGLAVVPCIVAAGFADERFVLALPFVVLWHWIGPDPTMPPQWRKAVQVSVAMVVGLIVVIVLRHFLTVGIIGPGIGNVPPYDYIGGNMAAIIGPRVREQPLTHLGSAFFAFRWMWALPVLLLWGSESSKVRRLTVLTLAALIIGIVAVWWGGDHTRSIAFMFPAFLWMIVELPRLKRGRERQLVVILLAMVFTPQISSDAGRTVGWVRPFPIVVMRMVTGADPASLLGHRPAPSPDVPRRP